MATFNSLQMSIHPVHTLAYLAGCPDSFSILLVSHPHRYLIGVQAGEAICRAVSRSESTKLSLDEPESENTWSLVLLELPAAMSPLGLAGPLVRLEKGLGVSHHCCPESVLVIVPCGAMFTPNLNFWRDNRSPLNVKTVRWVTGKVVPRSLWRNG